MLLGEITPKVYETEFPVLFSKRISSLIKFFETMFSPFSSILIKTSSFIDKRLKQKSIDISMEEISQQ